MRGRWTAFWGLLLMLQFRWPAAWLVGSKGSSYWDILRRAIFWPRKRAASFPGRWDTRRRGGAKAATKSTRIRPKAFLWSCINVDRIHLYNDQKCFAGFTKWSYKVCIQTTKQTNLLHLSNIGTKIDICVRKIKKWCISWACQQPRTLPM